MELNETWLRRASLSFDCLYSFTISLTIHRAIKRLGDEEKLTSQSWQHIKSRLYGHAVVEWCKVFGTDSEHTHWKQLIQEEEVFRKRIYSATGFDYKKWRDYRESLCDFRNQLVAHSLGDRPKSAPNLEPAFLVVKECHQWLVATIPRFPEVKYTGPASIEDLVNKFESEFCEENGCRMSDSEN